MTKQECFTLIAKVPQIIEEFCIMRGQITFSIDKMCPFLQTPSGCDYLVITPDRSIAFPSVEYVRNTVSKAGIKQGSSSIPVVVDARHIQAADFTAAKVSI